jgi:hypothetical protein
MLPRPLPDAPLLPEAMAAEEEADGAGAGAPDASWDVEDD